MQLKPTLALFGKPHPSGPQRRIPFLRTAEFNRRRLSRCGRQQRYSIVRTVSSSSRLPNCVSPMIERANTAVLRSLHFHLACAQCREDANQLVYICGSIFCQEEHSYNLTSKPCYCPYALPHGWPCGWEENGRWWCLVAACETVSVVSQRRAKYAPARTGRSSHTGDEETVVITNQR